MTEFILVLFLCSTVHKTCLPPHQFHARFDDPYKCMVVGYEEAARKMKEIDLEYKKSRTMSRLEDGAKNPKKIAGEIAIDWIPVIGALFQFTRFIGEVGGDLTKGKLEKSVTIDGCASCFIFWFDRGEIVQIMGNDVTTKSEVDKKY